MIEKSQLHANKKLGILKLVFIFLIIFSVILTFLHIKYSFFFFILVHGVVFSFFSLKGFSASSVSFHLLLGFLWGSALIIVVSGFLALFNIPLRMWTLILPSAICLVMIGFLDIDKDSLLFKINSDDIFLFILAAISLASHVLSIRGFWAPILHDPISHATWSKNIFDTGIVNYFYSPGLHMLSAFGMMADGVNVATYILRLTNIFNALAFVPIYFFLSVFFKNKVTAIVGSSLFLIGSFPTTLFLTSGKNALILGFSIMALMLTVFAINLSPPRKLILICVFLCTLILSHYPVAALGFLLIISFILVDKDFSVFISIGLAGVFGFFWGMKILPFFHASNEVNLLTNASVFLGLTDIPGILKSMFLEARNFYNTPTDTLLFYLGFLAILCIFLFSFKDRKNRAFALAIFLNIAIALLIHINPFLLNTFFIIYESLLICFPFFLYIAIASVMGNLYEFISQKIVKKRLDYLILILFLIFALFTSAKTYNKYKITQTSLNMVSGNDISAFNWIKQNLDNNSIILNNAAVNKNLPSIVFGSDGGTWIPVFTNNQIAMPFTEFQSKRSHQFYRYYQNLLNSRTPCADFDFLTSNNILYYYQDSHGVFSATLEGRIYPDNFEPVYSEEEITIYKINKCSN
ncbi:MAG: hypothetical protein VB108_09180 [Anaerolineaceae bacterium]|nr:hypothetical protein [Anaerolineaceae bacterium]